MQDVRAKQGSV